MTDRATAMSDPRVAALFSDGPTAASSELLARTLAASRSTRQRPALVAVAAGAPAMRSLPGGFATRRRLAVAGLLLVALLVVLFAVGRSRDDRRIVVPPSVAPTDSASASPGPAIPRGTVIHVPGSSATFAVVLQGGSRVGPDNELAGNGVRIVTQTKLTDTWDVVDVAWIVVSATDEPIDAVAASMLKGGWTASTPIDVPGLAGEILTSATTDSLDPVALVAARGVTYRIAAHHEAGGPLPESMLQSFLRNFTPLGSAPAETAYVDDTWDFTFRYDATPVEFLPGFELDDGVTRFPDSSCPSGTERTCDQYVDVIRRPNTSPLDIVVPDAGSISLEIDPSAADYARLAASWSATVGDPYVLPPYDLQGTQVFEVQHEGPCIADPTGWLCAEFDARFIHRGDQWLIVVAPVREGDHYNRLRAFMAGFSPLARA